MPSTRIHPRLHRAAFATHVLTAALITVSGLVVVLALIQATGHLGTPSACVVVPASVTGTITSAGPATVGGTSHATSPATSSMLASFNACALAPSVAQSLEAAAAKIAPIIYLAFAAARATRALDRLAVGLYTSEAARAVRMWAHVVLLGAIVTFAVQAMARRALANSILVHRIALADARHLAGVPWPEIFAAAGIYALYAALAETSRELEGTI